MADLTPQHYEVKQPGGIISPQEQLNKQLEEQRQIIIKGMDDDLRSGGKYEQIKGDLKYEVVGNIGIVIYKGTPNSWYKYSNGKVEYYTNFKGVEKDEDLPFALGKTGYELKDGKLSKNGIEIPQFLGDGRISPEFVTAIDYINLFEDMQGIFGGMKAIQNGKTLEEFNIGYFRRTIIGGVSRIKEVMYFYSKGYIKPEEFEKTLLVAIQELPNQCSDTRLYRTPKGQRIGMEVTKSELDEYLKPTKGAPLITQKMYDDCLRRIEARDRKLNGEKGVKEQSKTERKIEGTRNGFVDRVKGILGF